jgi:hypothetical protein
MAIDWNATGTMMQAWAGFAQAAAIAFAAWKAADTFRAWRKQKIEGRRIEEAERILTLAYRIQYAISEIRNRLLHVFEFERAETRLRERYADLDSLTENHKKSLITSQVVYDRIDIHAKEFYNLTQTKPIASALFGKDIGSHLNSLFRIQLSIQLAAHRYATEDCDESTAVKSTKFGLWEREGREDDKIWHEVEELVKRLNDRLLIVVRGEDQKVG